MSTQIVRQISCFDYGIISLQGTGLHNKTLLTERMRLCKYDCMYNFWSLLHLVCNDYAVKGEMFLC